MSDELVAIADAPEAERFEAHLGRELAGILEYRLAGQRRILTHTEVLPRFEGRGIGASLARFAMDEARSSNRRVTVRCPFVRGWLDRHPEYDDLVVGRPEPGGRA